MSLLISVYMGSQHKNADVLSRIPARKCLRTDCTRCTRDVCHVNKKQRANTVISQVMGWLGISLDRLSGRDVVRLDSTAKALYSQWKTLKMDNGVLCREWYPHGTGRAARSVLQVVAPSEVRQRILHFLHNSPSGGHLGRTKTLLWVWQRFYWPYCKEDVIHWCKDVTCVVEANQVQGGNGPNGAMSLYVPH